ncbi:MAG: hypothetical protein EOM83_07405 [Clostridia bacterium]|nr:hypothetical protein [Clostridia bacterium]
MRSSLKDTDVKVVRAKARQFLTMLSDLVLLQACALASSPSADGGVRGGLPLKGWVIEMLQMSYTQ